MKKKQLLKKVGDLLQRRPRVFRTVKLRVLLLFICCLPLSATVYSQQIDRQQITTRVIRGVVTDGENIPLPGVSVVVKGANAGTVTDRDGSFEIRVPADTSLVLRFSFIGMTTHYVKTGDQTDLKVVMKASEEALTEVVVTGLAVATDRTKVPFSISKVDDKLINSVPALDLSQTLRAKVAGITINQTEGDDGASVYLRGAKSFYGHISPLIVIDGYVSGLTLDDLNPQDVESIEVVKGAAGAALYGTRAEGGVIHVITKKGKDAQGRLNITFENEYGLNNVQRTPQVASLHRYKTDPNDEFGFAYLTNQDGTSTTQRIPNLQENGFSPILSPYKNYYDNVDLLLNDKSFYSNYLSLASAGEKYNAYLSFQNQQNAGIVEPLDANIRRTAKLNLQLRPNDRWRIETNVHYFYNSKPSVLASGGSPDAFFGYVLMQEPFINLDVKDEDGDYLAVPRGYEVQNLNLNSNPLYAYSKRKYKNTGHEILAGGKIRYSILSSLYAEAAGSINQTFSESSSLYPKGFKTALESATLNNGNLSLSSGRSTFINGQLQLNYGDRFGDFDIGASAKMVYESSFSSSFGASGYDFAVPLYTLGNAASTSYSAWGSAEEGSKTVNYGYFLNLKAGYKDKLYLDVLGRIDQSSRYGKNAQTAFFPRVSLAYRLTKDFNLGKNVDELKIRTSYGQAGRLPGFNAKESLASVSSAGISITQNENTYLERSYTSELETGFDATFFKRFNVTFNYANANSRGDFVQPPIFIPTLGTAPAYKNFGRITSNSIELETSVNGIIDTKILRLDAGLTFARTRSEIKELGNGLTPFNSGLFHKDTGLSPWSFWGQKVLTSLSELESVDGLVVNTAGGTHPLEDFAVNRQGHVVLKNSIGTESEKPLLLEEDGVAKSVFLGDGQADFSAGFNTTVTLFGNLHLYATLDWQHGGKKYSSTTQYMTSYDRSGLWQEYALAGLPEAYSYALYNGNAVTSVWLEDNSYVSLREVSLGYSLPQSFVKKSGVFQNVRISVTGRNLFTWSNFSGSNPEGYNDDFPYPVYRTYTAKLTINF